jgi:hypothetical protein
MPEQLTSKMVAQELDTDPRTLRRFLRDDVTYKNAGAGGRYAFTTRDLATLKKRFGAWQAGVEARRSKRNTSGLINRTRVPDIEPDVILIPKCTPELRKREAEQVERLERRLKECGLHVTQMRERAEWAAVAS